MKEITPDYDWPVLFRKYSNRRGGEVIAIFPYDAASYDPYQCGCYVHVGQHGACDPHCVINDTRLATANEYAELKAELESKPYEYRLRVFMRYASRHALTVRKRELERIK